MLMIFNNILAHEECCQRLIIHRDISYNNILLVHNEEHSKSPYKYRGMLIDFDYAASTKQHSKIGQRTVRSPSSQMYALITRVVF
jgi:serine/threonine protein kinase